VGRWLGGSEKPQGCGNFALRYRAVAIAESEARALAFEKAEARMMTFDEQDDEVVPQSPQPKSLSEFFRESPLVGVELDLERLKDEGREVQFE